MSYLADETLKRSARLVAFGWSRAPWGVELPELKEGKKMPEVTVTVDELLLGPEGSQVEMEEPVAAEPTTVKAEPAATAPGHYIPFEDWDVGPFSRDNREARGHSDPDLSE